MAAPHAILSAPLASSTGRVVAAARPRAAVAAVLPRGRPAAALRRSSQRRAAAGRQLTVVRAVVNVDDKNFEAEVLKSELPVLVDFWANWCGPCRLMHPMMDWAEKEYAGVLKVVKIEADSSPETIEKYKVYGLPCFILFSGGEEVAESHSEGAMAKPALIKYLEKHGYVPAAAAKV